MHLRAGDSVVDNQATPLGVDAIVIRQQRELALNDAGALVRLRRCQTKAIP